MKDIMLTVKSVQKSNGAEPLEIEFVSTGKYYKKNGCHYIIYEETELSGLAGHKTSLKVTPDSVTMRRYGAMPVLMYFQVGQRQTTDYQTPYGAIKIDYLTTALDCQLLADEGNINIQYQLTMNSLEQAMHQLNISYQAKNIAI